MDICFIDLGLPSGTLWADKNLVIDGKSDFMWAQVDLGNKNCPYLEEIKAEVDGESESICIVKKYNSHECYGMVDNKSYLELTDDIANQLGNKRWRIPSILEFIELLDVDLCEIETDAENKGVWIKSKKNGNKVFFALGKYWSNTIYEIDPRHAFYFYVNYNKVVELCDIAISYLLRECNCYIRPVLIKN